MDEIERNLNLVKCNKCGKYSQRYHVLTYGTCLCGNVLDEKSKFKYEMKQKLHLWSKKKKGNSICITQKKKEIK